MGTIPSNPSHTSLLTTRWWRQQTVLLQVKSTENRWTFHDTGPLVKQSIQGHTTSPTVVDFNGDGIPDYLGGAEDGRLYYQRNPRSN